MVRRVFWSAFWLAIILVAVKAYYLGVPPARALADSGNYLRSLAAISYLDVLFAAIVWSCGRVLLMLARRPLTARAVAASVVAFSAFSGVYAIANVLVFGIFGGFLTYPLLALVGNVRMLSSSASAYLTPSVITALVVVPLAYVAIIEASVRLLPEKRGSWRSRHGVTFASLGAWMILGVYGFSAEWTTRQDRKIADNPQWVLISSWWQVVTGDGTVRLADKFPPDDLKDFEPLGALPPSPSAVLRRIRSTGRAPATRRPPNVILIVLESVGARWTSLNGGPYESTPTLKKESAHALVVDNAYAHIGRSSNSLAAILMSAYPKLGFRDITEEYPELPGTSLAAVFRDHGYQTAFMTPSDLSWAGWGAFLGKRGFAELRDYHQLACSPLVSSWGVEDRCMVEGMIEFVERNPTRPFFLVGWTTQTHHPYEPTPGVPLLPMEHEPVPDQYELSRYLNVLHETDSQLGALFDTVRRRGLEQDTLIVIVGDHGQAFGYPHDTYIQGRTVYEEDVHVPLMFWYPRRYRTAMRSANIGSHVDLAPTIAVLAGLPAAPDWQGRNMLDPAHAPRAYFYVAEDHFSLGVREGRWKYVLDLREGIDQLYDLELDPDEQHNLAKSDPDRCAALRQRLAAWTEANRRQYEHAHEPDVKAVPAASASDRK